MLNIKELYRIATTILSHYALDSAGIHGISHWGRVLEKGMHHLPATKPSWT